MKTWGLASLAGLTLEACLMEYLTDRMSVLWAADVKRVNGQGPRMRNSERGVILADFLVAGREIRGFIDCKAKSGFGERRDRNRFEQMIDGDAWASYEKLLETGANVYLLFLEERTRGILLGEMRTIKSGGQPVDDVWNGESVKRFDRRILTGVGNWDAEDGDLRKVKFNVNWDKVRNLMQQLALDLDFEEAI